jgi:alpha-D-ribose 1-methylphosphonate 5-triphosphate synthase subunit PhnH
VLHDCDAPPPGNPAAAVLLLALMDADSRLWLSPALARGGAGAWLRFHTGCALVHDPARAHFAWAAAPAELPSLDLFPQGSDNHPEEAATCLVDVPGLTAPAAEVAEPEDDSLILRGPGIRDQARLRIHGVCSQVMNQLRFGLSGNHARFPCGVDVFLATPGQIAGLPRSTRIETGA